MDSPSYDQPIERSQSSTYRSDLLPTIARNFADDNATQIEVAQWTKLSSSVVHEVTPDHKMKKELLENLRTSLIADLESTDWMYD